MNHCVGGYWQSVRDGESHIYSIRDPENKPHATLEFNPPDETLWKHIGEAVRPDDGYAHDRSYLDGAFYRDENGTLQYDPDSTAMAMFDSQDHYDDWSNRPNDFEPRPLGRFKEADPIKPFEEPPTDLYRQPPGSMRNTKMWAAIPTEPNEHKRAVLNQHMGPHDRTPNTQANTHIKDWLDHHRNNGWEIERSHNFFYPNDWDEYRHYGEAYDDEMPGRIYNYDRREGSGAARRLDDWYDDHFKQNPALWTEQPGDQGQELDKYGFPKGSDDDDGYDRMDVDWGDLDQDAMRSLADTYDRGAWHTHDWEGLARAYWHAWNLEKPHLTPENLDQRKRWKDAMDKKIEGLQEKVDDWQQNDSNYYDHSIKDLQEKYKELGGPVPNDEDGNEEYGWEEDHPSIDPDTWQEAKQLYDHQVNGTFPSYEDVRPPDPPSPTGEPPAGGMPGAISRRHAEFDATPTYNDGLAQKFIYNPAADEFHWGPGHGTIKAQLFREQGIGDTDTRDWIEGMYRPRENMVEVYDGEPAQRQYVHDRALQEAAQRPWERPSATGSPWVASTLDHPDPAFAEAMRQAYAGDLVNLDEERRKRQCPVCGGAIDRGVYPTCQACGWREGDPVMTCPNCHAKNTIHLEPATSGLAPDRERPYACGACKARFTTQEAEQLDGW
jgi:hypothetical protein